ncbi:hypothetical protein RJ639_044498 [Escallonia herrerae]|uniref:Uncharacterized protein n=1 Tax=Escallonia herrerae TaxID=1293975 RepID=A0AA88WCK6_9ASTE|nr:hypothetical protein RJ639_044498 [Escallonia herrerae]
MLKNMVAKNRQNLARQVARGTIVSLDSRRTPTQATSYPLVFGAAFQETARVLSSSPTPQSGAAASRVPGFMKIRYVGQTTLGSAAIFGLFLGAGSLIHCGKSY